MYDDINQNNGQNVAPYKSTRSNNINSNPNVDINQGMQQDSYNQGINQNELNQFQANNQNQNMQQMMPEQANTMNYNNGVVNNQQPSNNNGLANMSNNVDTKKILNDNEIKKITFDYVVENSHGQKVKSSFDAINENEVRAFLVNEGYTVISITPRSKMNGEIKLFGGRKMKNSDLTFALTQLATYIKAGISLIDSVRILAKQTTDPKKRKVFDKIVYDLVMGEDFSKALENQSDVFPKLLINMVKTSEMTGDLPTVLDEMSEYYQQIEETRKQVVASLTYPAIIFIFAVVVVTFCFLWIVPTFTGMYTDQSDLPAVTQVTLAISDFMGNWYLLIAGLLVAIFLGYKYAYDNVKSFRKTMQMFYMRLPVIGNIIIYGEVTTFTKTFASLINHNVNIEQSMEVLSKITNNEVYKDIIKNTIDTLQSGGKISESFRGNWAFPIVAYEMLVTGESTGQLGLMMEKVAEHYNSLHTNAMTSLKSLIEPITIIFLAVMVGFVLISMFLPMFDMYSQVM